MSAVSRFLDLSSSPRFKGWPVVGEIQQGPKIPFFGSTINYRLQTGNGVEEYTSIIRTFGWAVVFGVTSQEEVLTLCQWKPGLNQASWELPPGGMGELAFKATDEEILVQTQKMYQKETGYGQGRWHDLGHILIETGKYRGAGPEDHGLKAYLFLAQDLKQVHPSREHNPNEIMETILVPLVEFRDVLESGLFVEESAVACAYKALLQLGYLRWEL